MPFKVGDFVLVSRQLWNPTVLSQVTWIGEMGMANVRNLSTGHVTAVLLDVSYVVRCIVSFAGPVPCPSR